MSKVDVTTLTSVVEIVRIAGEPRSKPAGEFVGAEVTVDIDDKRGFRSRVTIGVFAPSAPAMPMADLKADILAEAKRVVMEASRLWPEAR